MTTKLTASRFRIRRPDPQPAAAQPAAAGAAAPLPQDTPRLTPRAVAAQTPPRTAAPAQQAPAALFEPDEDGFGDRRFPTADRAAPAAASAPQPAPDPVGATDIDAIRREGLTGRQLRMARREAQRRNLPATSDYDAVRLLRLAGIDPFGQSGVLELVAEAGGTAPPDGPPGRAIVASAAADAVRLPATIKPVQVPSTEMRAEQGHARDILKIQRDLARRRRRKMVLLSARLFFFVGLPTLLTAIYFYTVATPLYATKSEFSVQQSANPSTPAGMGGLLSGTALATSQDSIAVQGYLQSRDAMLRLDRDIGFRSHFSDPRIDPIQRLDPDATQEAAYKIYKRNISIGYDPTEGIIKMEIIAADPQTSERFARALIGYAEEQVDQLTQRLREDQMKGARESYERAEQEMLAAQRRVVELQKKFDVLSSEVEVSLITAQIGQLEGQLSADRLSLQQMESNASPNKARMDPLIRRIAALEEEIALLRSKLTQDSATGLSIAEVQGELLVAQADVQTRQLLLSQSLTAMETARIEANRQVRYLSLSVSPIAPDEATYPRAFENTMVALLVFAGIYLMISMTAAILREQVSA